MAYHLPISGEAPSVIEDMTTDWLSEKLPALSLFNANEASLLIEKHLSCRQTKETNFME